MSHTPGHNIDHDIGVPRLPEPTPQWSTAWMRDFIRVLTDWMRRMTSLTYDEMNREAIRTVTSDVVMGPGDGCILADTSGGDIDVTLPDPEQVLGMEFTVKRLNAGGGALTVLTPSGTIDNAASKTITSIYSSIRVKSDGTNYWIVTSF